ncbi:MAG: TIGR03790 family protein [Planctomycetes bacterium]|nr:TIGR03790 family protein [Planctomycetota bacterium]
MKWILVLAALLAGGLEALEPANVLVVYNDKMEGSKEIADYYAELRGIPKAQILKISASQNEEITREEFNKDVQPPIEEYVKANDHILCIVLCRGVPLKIKRTMTPVDQFRGHDEAAVDSELMILRAEDRGTDSAKRNPYLNSDRALTLEDKVLVVSRLDGATVELAKRLVEKAILAEALTPEGHSYLDTRGLTGGDGYQFRDDKMEKVEDAWKLLGIPYTHDTAPEVVDLSTYKDPLHYQGWYAGGQNPKGTVKFRTGGIDVHLHSFSANTVRGTKSNWVGPLLSWNATCTYGTVYEPYTVGYPYEEVMWDRLARGWQFGEAGMAANELLSWQAIFVGDPLYRPYAQGWKERKERARKALSYRLVPEGEPVDESGLVMLDACVKLLNARADAIKALVKTDAKAALELFDDARFLVQELGQEAWLTALGEPFEKEFNARMTAMRAAAKAELTDTAELERALAEWKGLPVYPKLEKLRDELAEEQEKESSKLLKKAQSSQKGKKWLRAWKEAAQAADYRLSASGAAAVKLLDELKPNMDGVKADADKELKPDVEKAQKEFDRKRYAEAKKALGSEWRHYPECDQRKAAEALAKKIDAELAKGK